MHSGKTNVDTRAAYIPASTCYGLPLPGTGAGAPILHSPVTFPFWLHNVFPPQEIFQWKGTPGCRKPLVLLEWSAPLAVLLPSSCGMEDRPFLELPSTRRPLQSSNCFFCCTCDNPSSLCFNLSDNPQYVLNFFDFFPFLFSSYGFFFSFHLLACCSLVVCLGRSVSFESPAIHEDAIPLWNGCSWIVFFFWYCRTEEYNVSNSVLFLRLSALGWENNTRRELLNLLQAQVVTNTNWKESGKKK